MKTPVETPTFLLFNWKFWTFFMAISAQLWLLVIDL